MKHALLLGTLTFLSMALAPRPAAAEKARPDSLTVFGTTYCFSWAPADAACDVRVGEHPNAERVLGMTICTGEVPSGIHCDIGPFGDSAAASARRASKTGVAVPVWGKTFCIGDVPANTRCDVAINDTRTAAIDGAESRRQM